MEDNFIYLKIKKKAKKQGMPVPKDWKERIRKYRKIGKEKGVTIFFVDHADRHRVLLDLHIFVISSDWAVRMVLDDNPETKRAFLRMLDQERKMTYHLTENAF